MLIVRGPAGLLERCSANHECRRSAPAIQPGSCHLVARKSVQDVAVEPFRQIIAAASRDAACPNHMQSAFHRRSSEFTCIRRREASESLWPMVKPPRLAGWFLEQQLEELPLCEPQQQRAGQPQQQQRLSGRCGVAVRTARSGLASIAGTGTLHGAPGRAGAIQTADLCPKTASGQIRWPHPEAGRRLPNVSGCLFI